MENNGIFTIGVEGQPINKDHINTFLESIASYMKQYDPLLSNAFSFVKVRKLKQNHYCIVWCS